MTPIQITTCANGEKRGHITARILVDAKKRTYCPHESWDKFLETKPKWVQILLGNVFFYTNDGYIDIYLLISKLNKHDFLLFVSDGSVDFHDMAFGWILSTPKGERLVAANGPSSGRGSSLQSEADDI